MKFIEFTVNTTESASELVADILWRYTVYGVAVLSGADVLELVTNRRDTFDYIDEKLLEKSKDQAYVKSYVEIGEAEKVSKELNEALNALAENAKGNVETGTLEVTRREVDGDAWIDVWKKHFRPIKYGKITVCPKWIEYKPAEGEQVVYIDSNMAFGTGEHETTAMCIELMEKYVEKSDVLLDVGTGSGILGISAVKLGADQAVMTDIDAVAVLSAAHNAEINGVSDKCKICRADLLCGVENIGTVATANITAEILVRLAPDISKQLKKGGIAILSGIIKARLDLVKQTYAKFGFTPVETVGRGEWLALVLKNGKEN